MIGFIGIILAFASFILRLMINGDETKELSEDGKAINLWGKVILSAVAIIIAIYMNYNGQSLKWFWLILIIAAFGFQAFVDWKYLKNSKQYIVSLIVLVMGVTLVNFIL